MYRCHPPTEVASRCFALFLLVITTALAMCGIAARADEASDVESFLARLGLADLQILHLEKQIDATRPGLPQQALAKRLANLYAERLMTTTEDQSRYDDIRAKIEQLLNKVPLPEEEIPALRVMLLSADYGRAEKLFNRWVEDPKQTDAFEEAKEILTKIAPQLQMYHQGLSEQLQKLQAEIEQIENEDALAVKEKEAAQANGFASRAGFFAGWSNYYFGLTKQNVGAAEPEFKVAREAFRQILGVQESEEYKDIEVEWLGLENIHRANALIGLGLVEAALGNLDDSRQCFQFLEHISAPPTLRDHAAYWFLRGLLNAGRFAEALQYAEEQVLKFAGGATSGKVAFCAMLVQAGFVSASGKADAQAGRLGQLGVQGLARLGQFPAIRQLITKYNIKLPTNGGGFYLTWLKGQQQFIDAETSKKEEDYQSAAETLVAALSDPESTKDVLSAGQCRYELGWCYFRLKEFERAAQNLSQASTAMKNGNQAKAIDAAWLTFHSYYELSKEEKRFLPAAIDALKTFKRDFPNAEQAKKADYFLGKLGKTVDSLEDSIANYRKVKPDSPNYLSAQAELCQLYYQQWSKVSGDDAKKLAAANDVYQALDSFLTAARRDDDTGRKLKCLLKGVDVALRSKKPDVSKADSFLAQAESLAKTLPETHSCVAELHYQQFQVAKRSSDTSEVQRHARWLAANATGSVYERSAVIVVANSLDQAAQSANGPERRQRQIEAARVYGRVVDLIGDSQQAISTNKNSRIASSRLAHFEFETGQFENAAGRLERLVAAFPTNKSYLRRAGLAQFRAGNFAAALPHWRKLLSGVKKNSVDWYEAKYHQIACLARTDKSDAKKVLEQFRLLHPKVSVDGWDEKFETLEKEISN